MADSKDANVLHLKKYANRRYYDAANSRHLKLQEIHALVKNGQSIHVTDGQNGNDLTSEVLLGLLLEFEPEKAAAIPGSILKWCIQAEADKVRAAVGDKSQPLWNAIADYQEQLGAEIKKSPSMQTIIPAVKELAKEIVVPLRDAMPPAPPASSKSDKPEPAQKSHNEDLEELIRAFETGEFKAI